MNAIAPDLSSELSYAVDRLLVSGRRVFGWGWVAHPSRAVKSVHLLVNAGSSQTRLPAGFGLARGDVKDAHPHLVGAATCGYVVTGFIPPQQRVTSARVEVELDDGTRADFDVTGVVESRDAGRGGGRLIKWLARAVWRRLKHGDIRGILRRATSQSFMAPTLDETDVTARLLPLLRQCRDVCVMFDHSMGGGANQYRRALVDARLAAGQTTLLCTYNLPLLEYRLHLLRPGHEELVLGTSTFLVLEEMLEEIRVTELFVNSPVSFDEPLVLAGWLARMRAEHPEVRLTVTAHDYFSVCPSFVLLNADGRYCGIPEVSECASCLKRHDASYVSLSPPTDIGSWRALWGRCLEAADEVRCFSNSSRAHLLRAYPALDAARVSVVPHEIDYRPARLPRADQRAPLVIGIVGEISVQKGALVVKEMMSRIDRDHPGIRVVVIGTLDVVHRSERLRVTGRYRREDLVDLVEAHGINMLLFPSIWPETFSYVVAEMIQLGLPIVAFDLGAPGERLRGYPKARLCREATASSALDTAVAFHRELGAAEADAA